MHREQAEVSEFQDRVVHINRVAKVVKGGRRFSFSALVVVGDGKGTVGAGSGKANEVPEAIRKGNDKARRSMVRVPLRNGTIPHQVTAKFCATHVLLRPASEGTGVIAGGAVRAIMETGGVRNILTKVIGSTNPHNVVEATMAALRALVSPDEMARRRGRAVEDIVR